MSDSKGPTVCWASGVGGICHLPWAHRGPHQFVTDSTPVRRVGPFTPAGDAISESISATLLAAGVPEAEDSFSRAMARIEELREANREKLERRDRAEWDCFFHFACENSLLKRQAE